MAKKTRKTVLASLEIHAMSDWFSIDRFRNFSFDRDQGVEIVPLSGSARSIRVRYSNGGLHVGNDEANVLNCLVRIALKPRSGIKSLRSGKGDLGSLVYAYREGAFYSDPSHSEGQGKPPLNHVTITFETVRGKKRS